MDTITHYRAIKSALHAPYVAESAEAQALHTAYLDAAMCLGSLNQPQLKALTAFIAASAVRRQSETTPDTLREAHPPLPNL